MRIIVAPDSFKGSLSAVEVANAIAKGILAVFDAAEIYKVPIADGGEGTVDALVTATLGRTLKEEVKGPLGDNVAACWGILGDTKTAVIEMAAASGITLLPEEKRNPLQATTYGTGQLIKAALDQGLRDVIIGIGGSATNDGGVGMAKALGVKFLDASNRELPDGGAALQDLARIDVTGLDKRLTEANIMVACDVNNPLCGPKGASAVYGPQKGATPLMVKTLDRALSHYAEIAAQTFGKDISRYAGAGAAGGLGAGLLLFTSAILRPGVDIVLEAVRFEEKVQQADLVITGEGNTDFQTAYGKAPVGIAKIAKKYHVPVICLSGGLGEGCEKVLQCGIDGLMSIVPRPMILDDCIIHAAQLTEASAARLCRLLAVGKLLQEKSTIVNGTGFSTHRCH
ncbi:glycerate kinase [Lucifera butyrica]|uniref:Glycerate kinase n=1 Tax=Lucifera butyrica TaxID=1351585 RepID=A0A498R8L1_9FIRM|nr:glycerate kinase [Lucifera butyrica]VBB07721.1 glycerate kinase [Lucifera butyrica]